MAIYTILPDFFKSIEEDEKIYLTEILFVLTSRHNSYKVTKDKHGDILKIYQSIKQNADIIKTWLDLMSFKPSTFEKIDVDVTNIACEETKFVKICKETKGFNNLIVYSIQNIKKFNCDNKIVKFENKDIKIFDKDDALNELLPKIGNSTIYKNSIVSSGKSKIKDAKIKKNKDEKGQK